MPNTHLQNRFRGAVINGDGRVQARNYDITHHTGVIDVQQLPIGAAFVAVFGIIDNIYAIALLRQLPIVFLRFDQKLVQLLLLELADRIVVGGGCAAAVDLCQIFT